MPQAEHEPTWLPAKSAYDLWSTIYDEEPNGLIVLERRYAIPWLDPQPDEWILDAGCGTGDHLVAVGARGAVPIGLDLSLGMLGRARAKAPTIPVVAANLSKALPFLPASFDGVLCSLVSEHLTDLHRFFSEIRRVLRPEGRLVLTGFHPDRVADGLTAGFEVNKQRYRVDAAPHRLLDFVDAARRSGLNVGEIEEVQVDEALVETVPKVGKLLGQKLLFVMSARRSTG